MTQNTPLSFSTSPQPPETQAALLYELRNKNGLICKVTNYGATITELHIPDSKGQLADVVLGFESVEPYQDPACPFLGAVVGRVANRIEHGKFKLEGKDYSLVCNDPPHHLHGGVEGFHRKFWSAKPAATSEPNHIALELISPAGDQGYPAQLNAQVSYTLGDDNTLQVDMTATSDGVTLVNLAQHTYWNLGGHAAGSIEDHVLTLHAKEFTPGAHGAVPQGSTQDVAGTPLDFRSPKRVGKQLREAGGDPVGYDHNWVVDGPQDRLRRVAELYHPASGRLLELEANQPGVQFYSGNFLDGTFKGKGATYTQYAGLCLETQQHPNSINVPKWRDGVVLRPGDRYHHQMIFHFKTRNN